MSTTATPDDHKAYYPDAHPITIRVTGDQRTGRLLGAQLIGTRGTETAKRVDTYATALFHTMTVDQVSDLDLSYTHRWAHPGTPSKSPPKPGPVNTRPPRRLILSRRPEPRLINAIAVLSNRYVSGLPGDTPPGGASPSGYWTTEVDHDRTGGRGPGGHPP